MAEADMTPRRLILMRHGDALAGDVDHARPLDPVGRTRAHDVGLQLAERAWHPEVVFVSDAVRTLDTWEASRPAVGLAVEPTHTRALYLAGQTELVDTLARVPDGKRAAMVIGHNPGLSWAASRFTEIRISLSPANAAVLETLAPSWCAAATADPGAWELLGFLRPRPA